jgi:hypothetical protein
LKSEFLDQIEKLYFFDLFYYFFIFSNNVDWKKKMMKKL